VAGTALGGDVFEGADCPFPIGAGRFCWHGRGDVGEVCGGAVHGHSHLAELDWHEPAEPLAAADRQLRSRGLRGGRKSAAARAAITSSSESM
jgi:hypothetical protein